MWKSTAKYEKLGNFIRQGEMTKGIRALAVKECSQKKKNVTGLIIVSLSTKVL